KEPVDFLPPHEYFSEKEAQEITAEDDIVKQDQTETIQQFETFTFTFEGTEIPPGVIPENAVDVVITTNGY
ncbi:MAG: hypothetical protein HUJ70_13220, partial [Pseudobutyrivibrio sp.]|nr:hypothetical protein [Pseudobutyrivibrio sp.]